MTKKIQEEIKTKKKKKKNGKDIVRAKSPTQAEIERKNVEYNYAIKNQLK